MNRPDIDEWALDGAEWMARRSKDPAHKVGAIILRADGTLASGGYNGFPRGVDDDPALYANKEVKRRRIQHAEINATTFARESLNGCTIYISPLYPCAQCAGNIINNGIKRVVARTSETASGWKESFAEAEQMFREAKIEVVIKNNKVEGN